MSKITKISAVLLVAAFAVVGVASSADAAFMTNLTVGSTGADVTALQTFLIGKGYSIPAGATGYFGSQTQAATAAFQAANGIAPAVGYFGPITRAKVDSMMTSGGSTGGSTGGSSSSSDEEGYLDTFERMSSLSAEEVGEGEEDVEVLGVQFEAKDADQKIERVTVNIDNPTDTSNTKKLNKIVTEVALFLDGEELDRMDVKDGSYDRNAGTSSNGLYTFRFTGLDGVVKEGDEGELTVAVTGVDNIDTASNQDGFDIYIPANGIRAVSPNGVDDTYDSSAHETTFTVETFASAANLEMKVNKTSDSPDEQVVIVDSEGDQIELLQFTILADGSDLEVFDIPINLFSTNANIDDIINNLTIEWDGGDKTENVTANVLTDQVVFDDLGISIDEGDKVEFTVFGDSATSSLAAAQGVTLAASTTVDSIDAEDATGETVADGDASGSATGDTQHLFTIAPVIEVLSVDIDQIDNGQNPAESANTTIKVKVTAEGGTIYLNGDDSSTYLSRFVVPSIYGSGTTVASTTASTTVYSLSGDYDVTASGAGGEYYTINEGDSMTITINTTLSQSTVTTSAVSAGLKVGFFQFGTDNTSEATRSAIDLDWTDLTDQTQTGTVSLVNAS